MHMNILLIPDYLCNKARQSVFAMMNKIKMLEIPPSTVLHLYQTIVQPVLVYGSDIWVVTARGLAEADNVFNWYLGLVLRVKLSTSKIMMAGEVGMFPPSVQCQKNVLMYLQRLNSMPAGSILHQYLPSQRGSAT